jgi:UMF1 family MFS transporter
MTTTTLNAQAKLLKRRRATSRERWAWYLYDFGNSAYAAVVLLAVYSAYFKGSVVGGVHGSFLWGLSVAIAMAVVAIISPVLGAVADFSGTKKRFLLFFTVMACIFTSLLFFVTKGDVWQGMLFFILAEVGYRSAQVFYNALLPEIAQPEEIGRISGAGWAIGNLGGILCLLIILPLIMFIEGAIMVRLSLVITAVFFALFSLPIFINLRERAEPQPLPEGESYLSVGFRRAFGTLRTARSFKEFIRFVLAFLVYNDGVMMTLNFASILGAVLFGLEQQGLIVFVIVVQVTSTFGAYAFGLMADRWSAKLSLLSSILMLMGVVVGLYFVYSVLGFFLLGALAGFAMAGIQSVSRTMVGVLSPEGQSAEFYGFFAVAGRTSSFIGPAVFGWLVQRAARWYEFQGLSAALADQSAHRVSIFSIAVFLGVGLVLLLSVNERQARQRLAELSEA